MHKYQLISRIHVKKNNIKYYIKWKMNSVKDSNYAQEISTHSKDAFSPVACKVLESSISECVTTLKESLFGSRTS